MELPGFYFDPVKKRYFPGKAPILPAPHIAAPSKTKQTRQASLPTNHVLISLRGSPLSSSSRSRLLRNTVDNHYSRTETSQIRTVPESRSLSAISLSSDGTSCVVADRAGHVFSSVRASGPRPSDGTEVPWSWWTEEANLPGEATSLHVVGQRYVATCLEFKSRILVGRVTDNETSPDSYLLNFPKVYDISATHFDGRSLSLAVQGGVSHVPDIDNPRLFRHSLNLDAVSIHRKADLIYAGLRNGLVCRIDTRLPKCHEFLLYGSTPSPVRKVSVIGASELFVARQNGELHLFDMRRIVAARSERSDPLVSYMGLVRSSSRPLGIAHDFSGNYIFAAGDDLSVCGWNMRTGARLRVPSTPGVESYLLSNHFDAQVTGMCIVRSAWQLEMLYLTSGSTVMSYQLPAYYESTSER